MRTEVQTVQERRRRERESSNAGGATGGELSRVNAVPMVFFCGLDRMLLDAGRGLESWWLGVVSTLPWAVK